MAISQLPGIDKSITQLQPKDLVKLVPLFSSLPEAAQEKIAKLAHPVNYLESDTIIGTGEHGDALYIIMQGRVNVLAQKEDSLEVIAELAAGDFFGEMALLGDHVRRADVRALSACTLLRIRAQDVLELGEQYHEITDQLTRAKEERLA